VLQPFQIDEISGCGIILLTGGKEPRHFAGWVPSSRIADAQSWIDALNGVIRSVLQQAPVSTSDRQIVALRFECGSENAPDDPFGLETIELTEVGALRYERRRQPARVSLVGSVDPQRFQKVIASLRATTFPTPPQTRFVPGASIVKITTMPSEQGVSVDYFEALRMDGYRDVVRDLSNLAEGLRDSKAAILGTWNFVPAH